MELVVAGGPRALVGGKGAQLTALRDLGMPVPPFFVVPVAAPLDRIAILRALDDLGPGPFAVRSSATGEDSGEASFAGQFDSFLYVDGGDAVLAAAEKCRASVDSERVRVYREHHGLSADATRMAVVVQQMVPARASGVMFTVDPADPVKGDVLVSAAFGVGEGVVGGHADTDTYRIDGSVVTAEVTDKRRKVDRAPDGTAAMDVPEALRGARCLDDAAVTRLADLGRRLEAHFGQPQDIEWAVDQCGALWLLQTRPLTAVGPRDGRTYTWDNSNIIESYAGITTPLTYSFARGAYEVVYRQFCEVMGVPRETIEENAAVFKAMIGLLRGRVFYRLDSWYRVLAMLPGAKFNKRFMEQMMGVRKQADLEGEPPASAFGKLRIYYLAWRMLRALFGLGKRTTAFRRIFASAYADWHPKDLAALRPEALVDAYRDLERRLLLNWKAPIINDFYAMIFFGTLKKMAGGLHDDLLCGEPGMESTLPTREALEMAARIRDDKDLRAAFERHDDAALLSRLGELPALRTWLDGFLDRYGDRCMEELKLETQTLRDDPTFVLAMLRNYLGRPDLTVAGLEAREHAVRAKAEAEVRVPFGKRLLFGWILRRARRHVRERENLRFARTRVFGLVRRIFRGLAGHLVRAGKLEAAPDVFYLTLDELIGAIEGTTPGADLRGLVAVRRAEFERYRVGPKPDDRFETRGAVHLGNTFTSTDAPPAATGDVLHGLGCAPGVVRAKARIIHSPKGDLRLDGQIMVCERTDPGWVPLFLTVGGLLVERGSALSHSAIVAREFGIPTVVGIPGLLKRVQDGQWVELDGKAGTVRLDVEAP